jgi:hypothetical protein
MEGKNGILDRLLPILIRAYAIWMTSRGASRLKEAAAIAHFISDGEESTASQ